MAARDRSRSPIPSQAVRVVDFRQPPIPAAAVLQVAGIRIRVSQRAQTIWLEVDYGCNGRQYRGRFVVVLDSLAVQEPEVHARSFTRDP